MKTGAYKSRQEKFGSILSLTSLPLPFSAKGVTPTTAEVNIIEYGKEEKFFPGKHDVSHKQLPIPWLKEINVVRNTCCGGMSCRAFVCTLYSIIIIATSKKRNTATAE